MTTYIIMPRSSRIAFLLYSWLNGSISTPQKIELSEWLEESKENVKFFNLINNPVFVKHARKELLN
ncbi:MAG: hypothetical protein QM764_04215 [Chitinophagaceae bacterium]